MSKDPKVGPGLGEKGETMTVHDQRYSRTSMSGRLSAAIVLMGLLAVLFAPGGGSPPAVAAGGAATVLSVIGSAEVQPGGVGDWKPITPGAALSPGDRIRTGADARLRILSPAGRPETVAGGTETTLRFDAAGGEAKAGGFGAFVSELLSEGSRTRINAVRGRDESLQAEWIDFNVIDPIPPEAIDSSLRLAAAYGREGAFNRSAFILWRLHSAFPDSPGIAALFESVLERYTPDGRWAADPTGGGSLAVSYTGDSEAYVYVFQTTSVGGDLRAEMRFPATAAVPGFGGTGFFPARVAPPALMLTQEAGVRVRTDDKPLSPVIETLPEGHPVWVREVRGRRCRVEGKTGVKGWVLCRKLSGDADEGAARSGDLLTTVHPHEEAAIDLGWGVAAAGPLPDGVLQTISAGVERTVAEGRHPSAEFIAEGLPPICGPVLVRRLPAGGSPSAP
jgi:hypothetical protein